MIKIEGYRKIIERRGSGGEHGYSDMVQYEILYTEGYNRMMCRLDNDYGECPSGRTSATRGGVFIYKVNRFGEIHYKPIKEIELDSVEHFIDVSRDGGDNRYPSGFAQIKKEYINLFEKTNRAKDKRQVYILIGDSGLGKSYIARKTGIATYETDSNPELPGEINEEIIVVGNKYKFDLEDIKSKIYDDGEIITLNFNKTKLCEK